MSLESMQIVAAKLLTDNAYQQRFFTDDPDNHAAYGLTRDEYAQMRTLDPKKLGISSEGYSGKRFERVESAFPMTLRALELLDPRARLTYLARTAFPPSDEEERKTFIAYVRAGESRPEHVQRFLEDLVEFELLLYDGPRPPGLPSYRFRPTVTRPKRSAYALTIRLRGPLPTILSNPQANVPEQYPDAPLELLILRDGSAIRLENLSGPAGALFHACDGTRTIAELSGKFGPQTEEAIERWLRFQAVEDASPVDAV